MSGYGSILTRNGHLCRRIVGISAREGYLQRQVRSLLKQKNCQLSCHFHNNSTPLNYAVRHCSKAPQTRDLSIRSLHTDLFARCSVQMKDFDETKYTKLTESDLQESPEIFDKNEHSDSWLSNPSDNRNESEKRPEVHHRHKSEKISMKDIEKMYSSPKGKLHDIYSRVSAEMKTPTFFMDFKQFSGKHAAWTCTIRVTWPEETTFSSNASNKSSAATACAIKVLHWLENQKRLKQGIPLIYSANDIQNVVNQPVNLSIKKETLDDMKDLLGKYEEIESVIKSTISTHSFEIQGFQQGAIIDPVGKSNPANRTPEKMQERNIIIQRRLEHRLMENSYQDLPIMNYKEQIIQEIEKNQVLVIKGDTGCGKTTQVPQFIMDSFAARGEATNCNILVSQPRRISAISLAERIAEERKEQVGDVVGYQVRLSQELPNTPAGILFCTTGLLLRKLQFNPTLQGCSHVIVDEAHERTINVDMSLVLLKRAIKKNPDLKVIIMSATINAELFQNYFNCNIVEVPGRTYPVEVNFMEDIDQIPLKTSNRFDMTFDDSDKPEGATIDIVKMGALISWIARNQPPGAILCFLPGWSEISKMRRYLDEYAYLHEKETMIVPVHSKISHYDQRKIFSKPPPHVRKIVLATDIAETGITVADVVYVVDSCVQKQVVWHEKRGVASIDNQWASQANIMQRKGRAGRVKPGISYHFIARQKFESLPAYPKPEVMRSSLEKTVLDSKTYSDEKAMDFLGSMPEPPGRRVISQAVHDLIQLGALDAQENLTPLGKRIALFTVHPRLSKALVYSSIFQCVSPMLTIASAMSSESEIFAGVLNDKIGIRSIKQYYHPTSDHVSLVWLFEQWKSINNSGREASRDFARKSKIYPERIFTLSKVRELIAEHLVYSEMLSAEVNIDDLKGIENEYAELDELVRGVLLSGLDQVLHMRDFDIRKNQLKRGIHTFIMQDGNRATLTPEGVNFKRKTWPSPYLTYVRSTHSEERRTSVIRETSIIAPLTVFLFSQGRILGYLHNAEQTKDQEQKIFLTIKGQKNIKLLCDKPTVDVLMPFRDAMWNVIRYLVTNHGAVESQNVHEFQRVDGFKTEMLQVLAKMLSEASQSIDNPEPEKTRQVDETENDQEEN